MTNDKMCAEYLKSVYCANRIINGLISKYISLGGVKGNYILRNPSEEEKIFLRGLFKKDYSDQKTISISLRKFELALQDTIFFDITLLNVLEAYSGESIVVRKQLDLEKEAAWVSFANDIKEKYSNKILLEWFHDVLENRSTGTFKWMIQIYRDDSNRLKGLLLSLHELINLTENLDDKMMLPVASALVTKDPHSLDRDKELFKLLIYYLEYKHQINATTIELKSNLLEKEKLINDTGYRTVITYGIAALDNDLRSLGWETFVKRREPLILNLLNLNSVGSLVVNQGTVFCFENPALFYAFMQTHPNRAAVCLSGQVNMCALKVLELLNDGHIDMYYNGDFDPEGLIIADKLNRRFSNFHVFGYQEELYIKAKSDNMLNQNRLVQLRSLEDDQLKNIGNLLIKHKHSGYQEYILKELMDLVSDFGKTNG